VTGIRRRPFPSRNGGAALLLVLWLIVLLTALVGAFAMTARVEHMQGQVLARGLAADSAARAGLEYALHRLALGDPRLQWQADGRVYDWQYAGAKVEVRIVSETGKVDLNEADATLLSGLLQALGSDAGEAARLAGAIIDWRDHDSLTQISGGAEDAGYASAGRAYGAKDAAFESIAELEQVLGFTPMSYAKIAPHVTVYSRLPRPDPAFAPAPVLDAMGMEGERIVGQRGQVDPVTGLPASGVPEFGGGAGQHGTYSIDSRAQLADGRQSLLRAVVRTGAPGVRGAAYTALDWEEGASPR